jgi:hypothetical protein
MSDTNGNAIPATSLKIKAESDDFASHYDCASGYVTTTYEMTITPDVAKSELYVSIRLKYENREFKPALIATTASGDLYTYSSTASVSFTKGKYYVITVKMKKETMAAEHKDRKDKIDETLKKMEEASRSNRANRIFGWLGAIIAVAAAIVTTVVTGGAAAAFAIAGAVVAVTALVMSETGLTDKLVNAIAESLEKSGMSKNGAKIAAALIVNLTIMAVSLGCSIGGMVSGFSAMGKAVLDMTQMAVRMAKLAQTAASIASTAVGVGALAAGTAATARSYQVGLAQSELSELEKIMTELQRRLDESEEELNAILEAIQNGLGQIAAILDSATDTQTEIAGQIGQMA